MKNRVNIVLTERTQDKRTHIASAIMNEGLTTCIVPAINGVASSARI
jgi:hypothetical protein